MSTSMITLFDAHPEVVFECLLGAAEQMGAGITMLDRKQWQVVLGEEGKGFQISASATDNGYNRTTLHMSWRPRGSGAAGKCARRLLKRTSLSVEQQAVPPTEP